MMNVLFVNPSQSRCGVHQYGRRFFSLLQMRPLISADYVECGSIDTGPAPDCDRYDAVIYNVHPGISNCCLKAPFQTKAAQIGIYHDGAMDQKFDAWIFSAPRQPMPAENVHFIGRPLPECFGNPKFLVGRNSGPLTVGLSGLVGAWAAEMVRYVTSQVTDIKIRLALPFSDHCDPGGAIASDSAQTCRMLVGDGNVEVTHEFKPELELLQWLYGNDVNCYIRPPLPSAGISSALDLALAARRPIVINRHPMFRHLSESSPSICIDDRPFMEIYSDGLSPLIQHYQRNDREVVSREIEAVLLHVVP